MMHEMSNKDIGSGLGGGEGKEQHSTETTAQTATTA